jgi:FkbM family methyltransferase
MAESSFHVAQTVSSSGHAYWTVLDAHAAVVGSADGYLRWLRVTRGIEELKTRMYARNLAYFLTWTAEAGLVLEQAAAGLQRFADFVHAVPATASDDFLLRRPERVEHVLATVRGFYMYLVEHELVEVQVLSHLHEVLELRDLGVMSYAQNGEDLLIAQHVRRRDRVTYIDVGCLWPRQYSNSYFFYQRGGWGLCIDPNPTFAEQYRSERPRDLFLNCGVAARDGSMTYYMHDNPVFNTLSTTHADELAARVTAMPDSSQREGRERTRAIEVAVTTLDRAVSLTNFDKRCEGHLDFLSIDVEGLELEVLQGFSFEALRPKLVVVEEVHRGPVARLTPEEMPIARALDAQRYRLAGHVGFNLYFLDQSQ